MPRLYPSPMQLRPLQHLDSPREVIRQFTPNWFAVVMGTGILALALPTLGAPRLGQGVWLASLLLFALFSVLYALRWLCYFDQARRIFGHATVSMFIGTIPMALATLLNGLPSYGVALWGDGVRALMLPIWWLDVAMALACGVVIPYLMFTRQEHSIDRMTAVWLLPVVAAEVAAASGGLMIPLLPPADAYVVLIASYVLWACWLFCCCAWRCINCRRAIWRLPAGWRWGRLALARWGCCCWGRMRAAFFQRRAWPRLAAWHRG